MTEAEYRTLPGSNRLPLFDEDDPRCEQLDRPRDPQYDTIREATDLDEATSLVANNLYEFRGGIRYMADNESSVFAYFWLKR